MIGKTAKLKPFGAPDTDAAIQGRTVVMDDSLYTRPSARGKRRAAKAMLRRKLKKQKQGQVQRS